MLVDIQLLWFEICIIKQAAFQSAFRLFPRVVPRIFFQATKIDHRQPDFHKKIEYLLIEKLRQFHRPFL